jgi:xanthine dehydrogenase iron-sulfur cluster and FAD-binding subunit A
MHVGIVGAGMIGSTVEHTPSLGLARLAGPDRHETRLWDRAMLMHSFSYARADRADQAVAAGADAGTMFLAGGTELLNWMQLGIAAPERVVDISRIAELGRMESLAGGALRIGALVRLNRRRPTSN